MCLGARDYSGVWWMNQWGTLDSGSLSLSGCNESWHDCHGVEGLCAPAGFRATDISGHGELATAEAKVSSILGSTEERGLRWLFWGDWWEWCHHPWALCVSADTEQNLLVRGSRLMYSFAVIARVHCRKRRGYNTRNSLLGESLKSLEGRGSWARPLRMWLPGHLGTGRSRALHLCQCQESGNQEAAHWNHSKKILLSLWSGEHSGHGCCHHNCLKFKKFSVWPLLWQLLLDACELWLEAGTPVWHYCLCHCPSTPSSWRLTLTCLWPSSC